jgi:ankyrin repeat protein
MSENQEFILRKAIKDGNIDLMNQLLAAGAYKNLSWPFRTPLMEVVDYWKEGDMENNEKAKIMFNLLLETGANINQDGFFSLRTALHEAVEKNKPTMVKFLLENGANPNTQDYRDETPLHAAAARNNIESYKDLLLAGADPTIVDVTSSVPDEYIDEENMSKFDKIKQEINTLKGVAAFKGIHPESEMLNMGNVYDQLDASSMKDLQDYSGGKRKRKTIKRRKTIRRRKTIKRKKPIKRRKQ